MKSIKMFGKSVPLLAIVMVSLLAIGASAVLVDYLSDTVTQDVAVKSPFFVGITEGKPSWSTTYCLRDEIWWKTGEPYGMVLSFPEGVEEDGTTIIHDWAWSDWEQSTATIEVYGGGTITFYTMSQNLANELIEAHEEIRVSNSAGITAEDFVNITLTVDSIYGDQGYGKLHIDQLGDIHNVLGSGGTQVELWDATDTSDWGPGEADVIMWTITFHPAASGTYTFSYRIVPDPTPTVT